VSFDLPGLVDDVVIHAVENAMKVAAAATRVFSGDDHPAESPSLRTTALLFGDDEPPASPPPSAPDDGGGGLHDGAGAAGQQYGGTVDAASLTDEKLATLLKQIFASNQQAREKVEAILGDISAKSKQIGPELGDPASLVAWQKYVDGKFGEIQTLLSDSQVDAKTQAAIMDALGDEYRGQGSDGGDGGPGNTGSGKGSGDSSAGGGGSADEAAAPPADPGAVAPAGATSSDAGVGPLSDPLAGMGPLGMGGMDPLGSLAGLGSALPGMLGGFGGGSQLDALGPAMAGLGSSIPAMAGQFSDKPIADSDKSADSFADTKPDPKDGDNAVQSHDEHADELKPDSSEQALSTERDGGKDTSSGPQPAGDGGTPVAAAPAAAGGQPSDTGSVVSMPDGSSVTAGDAHRAAAIRAVMNGSSVTAGYADQNVQIPPPGTPVTHPVDRNSLAPGDYAQFASKAPVMFMGNGKIWLDGQLQPVGALKSSPDFLGWTQPPVSTGAGVPAPAASPAPAVPPPVGKTTA
jgi:hypothetical protein